MSGRIRYTLKALFRRKRFESSMGEEMRHHVSAYAADLVRGGMSQEQADRRARIEFGSIESLREDCRQSAGLRWFDELRQDLRYAARQMVRSPTFTAAAVISLALGIGANSAIFSIMDEVLLKALPIRDPQTLFFLGHRSGADVSTSSNYPLLERYRSEPSLAGVAGYTWETFLLSSADGLEQVSGQFVTGNYHDVVGVPFVLGRGFATEPDRPDGRAPIAVISDSFWEWKFGRSPDVIGRTLSIGGRVLTIVGVTAAGFHGLEPGARLDITLPMFVRALDHAEFLTARDGWTSLTLVGRLQRDTREARARAAVSAIFQRFWMEPENAWARDPGTGTERLGEIAPAG
ncbi:MAG: ABC transporter permease, partial [Longimicrobiales bacterium]